MNKWLITWGAAVFAVVALMTPQAAFAQSRGAIVTVLPAGLPQWDAETLKLAGTIPIQELGRVKPLSTYASFKLLKFRGRRSLSDAAKSLDAMSWLLDCLFRPDLAMEFKQFQINDTEVMQALGLTYDSARGRGEFSADDLAAAEDAMLQKADEADKAKPEERTHFQLNILNLAHNYVEFLDIIHSFDFAHMEIQPDAAGTLAGIMPGPALGPGAKSGWRYSAALNASGALIARYSELDAKTEKSADDATASATLLDALALLRRAGTRSTEFTILPIPGEATWRAPGALFELAAKPGLDSATIAQVAALEKLADAPPASPEFKDALRAARQLLRAAAFVRGDAKHIDLEQFFYRVNPFYWALILFFLSFICNAVVWLKPNDNRLARAAFIATLIPTLIVIAGIVMRCVIRGRPPITNLYETTLFIPAVAISIALVMEWINRRRIAMGVASAFGMAAMFVSLRYESKDGLDTMESLRAVLDTNFWLSTHVTGEVIGYSAGLLAGAMGWIYVVGRALGIGKPATYVSIARMTYGTICFGIFFSLVGTILGGLWANYSWGRFWGWDPKENGALLVVLWELTILHAYWGRYVRGLGLSVMAIVAGVVVSISQWGVNLLGVGLHSYGFTTGIFINLCIFWGLNLLVIALAPAAWVREKHEPTP